MEIGYKEEKFNEKKHENSKAYGKTSKLYSLKIKV
jgi:hypothetical protein